MKTGILLTVLACAVVSAQASDETTAQAKQRLQERQQQRQAEQHAPATRAEVDELRKQVKELAATVETLRAEIAELRDKLQRMRAEATAAAKPPPKPKQLVTVGMTFNELKSLLNSDGDLVSDSVGTKTYRFHVGNGFPFLEGSKPSDGGDYLIVCDFEGGKLTSYYKTQSAASGRQVR